MSGGADLGGRTSRGAALTLGGNLLVKGLSIVVIAVVAQVLDAESYGPVVLALALFGFADVLTNPVLQTTLLREPDLQDKTVDVAWTISVARGLLLTLAFYCLAPWIAGFWPEKQAVMEGYLQALSFTFALTGLQNLHIIRLRRQLLFFRAFVVENISPFCGALFVIVALLWNREPVWMVIGPLVGAAVGSLVSLIVVRPLPRLRLARQEVRRLWSFSRPLMLSAMMMVVLLSGDHLFVEFMAGTFALGIYGLSYRWSNVGVNFAVHGLQNVLTPAYVKMRGDLPRLRHAVISSLTVLTAVCGIISALFLAFADEFFAFIGGDRWAGAEVVARALVPFVLSRGFNASLAPILLVLDKPHWLTAITAMNFVCFFPAMYLGFSLLGLTGIALAVALLALFASLVLMHLVDKLIDLTPRMLFQAVAPPFATAGLAALVGWLLVLPASDATLRLFLGGGVAVVTFFFIWEVACRQPIAQRMPQRSFFELAKMLAR